jgi:cytochrome c peroxidase
VKKQLRARAFLLASTFLICTSGQADTSGTADRQPPPAAAEDDKVWLLGAPPEPDDNKSTPAKVELGRDLFFDPAISGDGTVSCGTCHNPSLGWSDGLKTASGIGGHKLARATPTIVNTAYNTQFMWDGRNKSLEDQALGPMQSPQEMATDFPATLHRLAAIEGYRRLFEAAFPGESISQSTMARAIAAFERTVVSRESRFDRWIGGERDALTLQQWRGFQIFKDPSRGNCAACHSAPGMTDNGYHNIGIAAEPGRQDDGRFKIRALPSMKGAFKTPGLRDVELTAPYFHNGAAATLMEVVEHYARGGDDHSNRSPEIRTLNLSAADKEDLVAFMKALTGRPHAVMVPALPR